MEESLKPTQTVIPARQPDWKMYSPLALAYMGDAVFDLMIRTAVVSRGNTQPSKMHRQVSKIVCAGSQADMIHLLLPLLTEEEAAVFRRGHNADPHNTAKNASRRDYLEATGFEALLGYLFLNRRYERLQKLVEEGLAGTGHSDLKTSGMAQILQETDVRDL